MHEARFAHRLGGDTVQCVLCPHRCRVKEGRRGACGVRVNRHGRLHTLVYGRAIAAHVDPIEKKPLFHFLPGSLSYSLATAGCNLRCLHCQNAEISQMPTIHGRVGGSRAEPDAVVAEALRAGCRSVSYTYTEPTIFYEYAQAVGTRAVAEGLRNVFVTNGFTEAEPLEEASAWLHAANVDLKSFRDAFYRKVCRGRLTPVLETLERMRRLGIWLEVTTLVIPGLNDSEEELRDVARFLRGLGKEVPWHVSAFHPTYRMTGRPRTSPDRLRRAREIGLEEGLSFVYTGNLPGDFGENTYCPDCGDTVIRRRGFRVLSSGLDGDRCRRCGCRIPLFLDEPGGVRGGDDGRNG